MYSERGPNKQQYVYLARALEKNHTLIKIDVSLVFGGSPVCVPRGIREIIDRNKIIHKKLIMNFNLYRFKHNNKIPRYIIDIISRQL